VYIRGDLAKRPFVLTVDALELIKVRLRGDPHLGKVSLRRLHSRVNFPFQKRTFDCATRSDRPQPEAVSGNVPIGPNFLNSIWNHRPARVLAQLQGVAQFLSENILRTEETPGSMQSH
jgi:hypothetical protein